MNLNAVLLFCFNLHHVYTEIRSNHQQIKAVDVSLNEAEFTGNEGIDSTANETSEALQLTAEGRRPAFEEKPMILSPPILCNGPVARQTTGEYITHDNSTHHVRIDTRIELKLGQGHVSCFQVDLEVDENSNDTVRPTSSRATSVFYAFTYDEYIQHYVVSDSYLFGIPELTSSCKCDCPQSDEFCTYNFDHKFCRTREICIQKFFTDQQAYGCQSKKKAARLCCDVSVRPYREEVFQALKLSVPYSEAMLKIDIFILYNNEWLPFRSYNERLHNNRNQINSLDLNGDENHAKMNIVAHSGNARFQLDTWNKYYYHNTGQQFALLESPYQTNAGQSHSNKDYNFLIYHRGSWRISPGAGGVTALHNSHRPIVVNCRAQQYTDSFLPVAPTQVVRNSSGAVSFDPKPGLPLAVTQSEHVKDTTLETRDNVPSIAVFLKRESAPQLELDIFLKQHLSIVPHVHVSHFSSFKATIRLDRNRKRYLNVTLTNAYGQFALILYRDSSRRKVDVEVSTVTKLPFSTNYTDYVPLPHHIDSGRLLCIRAAESERTSCQYAAYFAEPLMTYSLSQTYIDSEGKCPGCNVDLDEGEGFLSFLNPRKWFNGIGSISEGLAVGLEVAFYVVLVLLIIAIVRRVLWPLVRWALCTTPPYARAKEKAVEV